MKFKVLKCPLFVFISFRILVTGSSVHLKAGHDLQTVTWTSRCWEWQSVRLAWCNPSLCRMAPPDSAQLRSREPHSSTSPSSPSLSPALLWCACTPLVPAGALSTGTAKMVGEHQPTGSLQAHSNSTCSVMWTPKKEQTPLSMFSCVPIALFRQRDVFCEPPNTFLSVHSSIHSAGFWSSRSLHINETSHHCRHDGNSNVTRSAKMKQEV